MSRGRPSGTRGFTLLEVMVAIAILGLGLTSILSAQAGAFQAAAHARHISQATGLARCKMLEVEELVLRVGFQQTDQFDEGACCDGDETIPMHCAWRIEAPIMPEPELGQLDLASSLDPSTLGPLGALMAPGGAKDMFSGTSNVTDLATTLFGSAAAIPQAGLPNDPSQPPPLPMLGPDGLPLDGGTLTPDAGLFAQSATDPNAPPTDGSGAQGMDAIASIAMGMVYPNIKQYFESSARRATVDLTWKEGTKVYTFTLEQWIVQPQPGLPDDDDPDADTPTPSPDDKKKKNHDDHEHDHDRDHHGLPDKLHLHR